MIRPHACHDGWIACKAAHGGNYGKTPSCALAAHVVSHTPQLLSYRRYRAVGEEKCQIEPSLHSPHLLQAAQVRDGLLFFCERAAAAARNQSIGSNNTDNCRFCPQVVMLLTMLDPWLRSYPSPLQPTWAAQTDAEEGFRGLGAKLA